MSTPTFDAAVFGQKIKRLRKAKSLSQEELAVAINKTVDTVSNIERGISMPRLETVCDLAAVLDVQVYELFYMQDIGAKDKEQIVLIEKIINSLKGQPKAVLEIAFDLVEHLVSLRQQLNLRLKK